MRTPAIFLLVFIILTITACSQETTANERDRFVLVEGGTFVNTASQHEESVVISDFYISKYEVTQREWMEVMGDNPSAFQGEQLPVEMVSWYDAVEYCNKRSIKEGLEPYYRIDKQAADPHNQSEYDPVKWTVTINPNANGYRLPTEAEWEYAAIGGKLSKSYTYSGSDTADDVAWYWRNAGEEYLEGDWNWPAIEHNKNTTQKVGSKQPNELGLYDMSGNVREWCWDWYEDENTSSGIYRVVKGGGWIGDVSNTEPTFRGKFEASGFGPDQGFRVVRGASR